MKRAGRHVRRVSLGGVVCLFLLCAIPAGARGQDALGTGNRLDANPARGSGGVNRPIRAEDYRARNLIVTGNVAGGRGFRGSVGYGAETDFRDVTGVDDLFEFRAGSAYSAPQISASPTWQQLRFGRDLGELALRRGDGGVTSGMVTQPQQPGAFDELPTQQPVDHRLRLDAILSGATTTTRIGAADSGRPIGVAFTEDGRMFRFDVSPLRGVTAVAQDDPIARLGVSPYDAARMRAESTTDRPQPRSPIQDGGFAGLLDSGRLQAESPLQSERVVSSADDVMTNILERIANRYAGRTDVAVHVDPSAVAQLDEEYQELRERLSLLSPAQRSRQRLEAASEQPVIAGVDPEEAGSEQVGHQPVDPRSPVEEEGVPPRTGVAETVPPGGLTRLFEALRHGEQIDRLAMEGNTRFDELMREGEEALRAGEYFDAERQFMRALRIAPGHPLAMIGAAHAQLGAGLQLPAAFSIRRVLRVHPELIDAEYERGLVPSRPRLVQVVDATEQRLERTPGDEADYGLVMAYIGRQLGDRVLIERGLSLMEEAAPDDPLLTVLRSIWLAPPEETPTPRNERTQPHPVPEK